LGDVASFEGDGQAAYSAAGEAALRRRLSREVWRALAEPAFAAALLSDPSRILGNAGWTLQQQRSLASIRAATVEDFARQAELLFWSGPRPAYAGVAELARAVGQ
jgi:hypothetical protein